MPTPNLGRIEEVDLRQIWPDEAADFTPWLSEHLILLSKALNRNLQLVEAEGQVGAFAVDVVADSDNGLVVIENQLERTDHSHLGQLLTYAAGRDARILIWITKEFRDEHRSVLDWLNHWTPEEIEVYGVEVRAIKIGDSLPAPEFRPVAFPNTWSRQVRSRRTASAIDSEEGRRRNAFFQALVDEARTRGLKSAKTTPSVQYQAFRSEVARPGINYFVELDRQGGAHVYLQIMTRSAEVNHRIINTLEVSCDVIEAEVGSEVEWRKSDGGKQTAILVHGKGSIDDSEERQAEVRTWILDTLEAMKSALDPRLQEIVAELDAEEADGVGGALSSDDL